MWWLGLLPMLILRAGCSAVTLELCS